MNTIFQALALKFSSVDNKTGCPYIIKVKFETYVTLHLYTTHTYQSKSISTENKQSVSSAISYIQRIYFNDSELKCVINSAYLNLHYSNFRYKDT